MRNATNVVVPRGMAAPVNQLAHTPAFPDATFKQVVRANVDTLYSSAFLDLTKEPMVLSVPDTHGRYYLLPLFDAWTNVFASPGSARPGTAPATSSSSAPTGRARCPPGCGRSIRRQTSYGFSGARRPTGRRTTQRCTPCRRATSSCRCPRSESRTQRRRARSTRARRQDAAHRQVKAMSATNYFDTLARLMKTNPRRPPMRRCWRSSRPSAIVPGQPSIRRASTRTSQRRSSARSASRCTSCSRASSSAPRASTAGTTPA